MILANTYQTLNLPTMTNIVSNKASTTHTQSLFALALDNHIIKRKKSQHFLGKGLLASLNGTIQRFAQLGRALIMMYRCFYFLMILFYLLFSTVLGHVWFSLKSSMTRLWVLLVFLLPGWPTLYLYH